MLRFTRPRNFAALARLTIKNSYGVEIEHATAKQLGHILQKAAAGFQQDWMPAALRAADVCKDADAKDLYRWFLGFTKCGILNDDVGDFFRKQKIILKTNSKHL